MNVNKARTDDQAARVKDFGGCAFEFPGGRDFGNTAIGKEQIVGAVKALRRIEKMAVFYEHCHEGFAADPGYAGTDLRSAAEQQPKSK
jgi:hypothetical protein